MNGSQHPEKAEWLNTHLLCTGPCDACLEPDRGDVDEALPLLKVLLDVVPGHHWLQLSKLQSQAVVLADLCKVLRTESTLA